MRTTTSQQEKQCKWWEHVSWRSWRTPEQGNPEICCFKGETGCPKDFETFFGQCPSMHTRKTCQQKHVKQKITWENPAKIWVSEDHWLQHPLAAPFFTKTGFQLSWFRCEISMSVFFSRPQQQTTLKPGNTKQIGISRGFKDKFGWRKFRPNHGVNNGPRVV